MKVFEAPRDRGTGPLPSTGGEPARDETQHVIEPTTDVWEKARTMRSYLEEVTGEIHKSRE